MMLLIINIRSRPPNANQNQNDNNQHDHGGGGQFSSFFSSFLGYQDNDEHVIDIDDHESEQATQNNQNQDVNQGGGQLTNYFSSLINNQDEDENFIDIDEHISEEIIEDNEIIDDHKSEEASENNEIIDGHEEVVNSNYFPSFLGGFWYYDEPVAHPEKIEKPKEPALEPEPASAGEVCYFLTQKMNAIRNSDAMQCRETSSYELMSVAARSFCESTTSEKLESCGNDVNCINNFLKESYETSRSLGACACHSVYNSFLALLSHTYLFCDDLDDVVNLNDDGRGGRFFGGFTSYLMEKIQTEVVKIKSYVDAFLSYFGLSKEKEIEKEKIEEEEEVEVEEEERSISISMEELNKRIEELTGAMADAVVDHVLQNKRGGRIGFCLQFPILAPLILQAFLSQLFAFLNSPLLVFPWISLELEIELSGSGSGDGSGSGSGSGSGIDPKSWTDDEPGDVDERDPRAFGLLFGPGGLFAPGGAKGPAAGEDADAGEDDDAGDDAGADAGADAGEDDEGEDDTEESGDESGSGSAEDAEVEAYVSLLLPTLALVSDKALLLELGEAWLNEIALSMYTNILILIYGALGCAITL